MIRIKRDISITIKPTHSCNMHCLHCFNGENLNDKKIVSPSTVCKFLELIAMEYENIGLTFHGGEPTLAGIEFYRKIFSCEKMLSEKYGAVFANNFTTNGVALNENLIELLMKHNTLFNISFDGPHNNILRYNTDIVYKTMCDLQKRRSRLRIYCVETAKSASSLVQTYEWFKEHNLDFKMVPVQPQGNAKENHDLIMDIPSFVSEWMKLYQLWLKDKECDIKFFTFEEFLELDASLHFKPHWFYRKLALNSDGKIYPFGRPNDVNFCLGDPYTLRNINDCFESDEYKRLISTLNSYMNDFCKCCKSANICNGIAICSSFIYGDDYDMLKYGCQMADEIFQSVTNINQEVKHDIENGNSDEYNNLVKKKFNSSVK